MTQSRNAVSNLVARYKAVLKNCHLLNVMAAAALAGAVVLGSAGMAVAEDVAPSYEDTSKYVEISNEVNGVAIAGDNDYISITDKGGRELHNWTSSSSNALYSWGAGDHKFTVSEGNDVTFTGTYTMDCTTEITGGGTLTVDGYLTQTDSGSKVLVDTTIKGEHSGLILGNDLTVGNVTLADGADLALFGNPDTVVESPEGKMVDGKSLNIAAGKTLTFAGNNEIRTSSPLADTSTAVLLMGEGDIASTDTLTVSTNPVLMTTMKAENIDIAEGGDLTIGQNDDGAPKGAGKLTADSIDIAAVGEMYVDYGTATVGTINNSGKIGVDDELTATDFTQNGGNVYVWDGTLTATNFTQTTGNVYLDDGTLTATNFTQNGGDVYAWGGTLSAADCTQNGGGVHVWGGTLTATDFTQTAGYISIGDESKLAVESFAQTGGSVEIWDGTLTATDFTQNAGTVEVKEKGKLAVENFTQNAGRVTVGEDATLKVNGTFANVAYAAGTSGISIEEDGTLDIAADKLVAATETATGYDYAAATDAKAINVAQGATVALTFDADKTLTTENLKDIKNAISGGSDFNGMLNIGTTQLVLADAEENADKTINYSAELGDVTSNTLKTKTVIVESSDEVAGGFGAVKLAEGATELAVKDSSNLFLSGSGPAVAKADDAPADIKLGAGSGLILNGSNQTIGGVDGADGELVLEGSGTTTIKGNVTVKGLELINSTTKIGCVVAIGTEGLEMNNSTLSVAYNETGAALDKEGSVTVDGDNIEGTGTINTESYFKAAAQHFANNDSITINAGKLNIVQDATTSEWSKGEDGFDANSGNAIDFAGITMADNSNLALNALNGDITTGAIQMDGGSLAINAAKGEITAANVTVNGGSVAVKGAISETTGLGNITVAALGDTKALMSVNSDATFAAEGINSVLVLGALPTPRAEATPELANPFTSHDMGKVAVGSSATAGNVAAGGMLIADMTNIDADDTLFTGAAAFAEGSALRVAGATLDAEDETGDGLVGQIFSAAPTIAVNSTSGETLVDLSTDNRLITLAYDSTAGTLKASAADLSTALPNMDSDLASLVGQAATTQHGNSFLTKALDVNAIADPAAASKAIEGAAKAGHAAGIGAGLQNVQAAGGANIEARQDSFAFNGNDTCNMLAMNGDGTIVPVADKQEGLGIWFMPMYKHSSADGFDSGSYDYGFDTDLYGATLGADYTFTSSLRLGLAFNVGTGESDSTGDFDGTENDFDYVGLTAYAGMNFGNLGLYADLGYTASSNDITQNNDLGHLSADSDADLISAGIKADYKIAMNNINLTPYAGIRLNYYSIDGYNTKFYGENVIDTDSSDYTIIEFPVGLTIDTTLNSGDWAITPSAGLGIKFAAGDLDHDQRVSFNGLAGSSTVSSEVADEVTFQGALGLGFAKDAYSIDLGYTLDLSENVESHGVNVNLRYEF